MYLSAAVFVTHVSGEVEAESEDDDDDDDDCKKGSMDEVCIYEVTVQILEITEIYSSAYY